MKILGIVGSPHRKIGNTYKIVERMLKETEKMGAETEIVLLSDLEINYCAGCATCLREGECPQKDDVKEIQEKMLAADGIVLGSPVYILHVTAQMKTFFDRCVSLGHRPCLQGKYGASVSVFAGVGSVEDVADYMNRILLGWGATPVGKVCGYAVIPGGLSQNVLDQAAQVGRELVQAIKEKRKPSEDWLNTKTKDQLKRLILRNKDFFKADYEYWKDKGWID
ncbi:Iron-sulfur flavoprotein [subsurface metagenome]|nr:iron-sulfur protein [Methanosarcinales archaeon]